MKLAHARAIIDGVTLTVARKLARKLGAEFGLKLTVHKRRELPFVITFRDHSRTAFRAVAAALSHLQHIDACFSTTRRSDT